MKTLISKLDSTCKRALESATAFAASHGHYNVELECFLLKLFEQINSDAHVIFRYYNIDIQKAISHLQTSTLKFPSGNLSAPVFSQHLLTTFEQAWFISSLNLGQSNIRSAAILLALVDIDILRGVGAEICPLLLGISRFDLRKDIYDILKVSHEKDINFREFLSQDQKKESIKVSGFLEQFTVNLTQKAQDFFLDPVFGRDEEISQIIDILSRRRQNNPILVGDSGVGKTAVIEGLAQKIVAKDVPLVLQESQIYSLDLGLLFAGAGFQGELESRLKKLISEISESSSIILFIDEAHMLMGKAMGDLSNLLKPALARGEIRVIAATTWSEYKRFFEKDAALTRRFEKVKIQEPSLQKSLDMLRISAEKLQSHHKITILNEALHAAVYLSHRFIPEKRLPDKAICILDTACAQVALSQTGFPHEIQATLSEQHILHTEKNTLLEEYRLGYDSVPHNKRLEQINLRLKELQDLHEKLSQQWQEQKRTIYDIQMLRRQISDLPVNDPKMPKLRKKIQDTLSATDSNRFVQCEVGRDAVARVISQWTNIPLATILSQSDGWVEDKLISELRRHIIGQSCAIKRIVQVVLQYQMALNNTQKPIGVFFLTGPSGVGKTETAHALVQVLMGHTRRLISLNMNEFQEPHTVATLKGAPPGYLGYGRGGIFTEAVRQNPYSVILMDEVDKAHPDVLNLFYQIFDKGTLEDSEGIEIDFSNTFFILTSNDCHTTISERCRSIKETEDTEIIFDALTSRITKELQDIYGISFISRTTVIPYMALKPQEVSEIVEIKLNSIEEKLVHSHQCTFKDLGLEKEKIIADFIGSGNTARSVENYISHHVLSQLTRLLQYRNEIAA